MSSNSSKAGSSALASLANDYADDDPSSLDKDQITDEEEDFAQKQNDSPQLDQQSTAVNQNEKETVAEPATSNQNIQETSTITTDTVVGEKSNGKESNSVIQTDEPINVDPANVVQFDGEPYQTHRDNVSSDSSSDSDFSANYDSDSESDGSDTKNEGNKDNKSKKTKIKQPPRNKGELSVLDLPPIEDLQISVPHEKAQAIGVIKSFVDPLVIVEGYPNSPALNLESVLFVEQGDRALGHIFDVFGPVKQPHYCVRFNSQDHIDARGIKTGMTVYCAPATPHSKFVFLAQLEKLKGTDASWLDDLEPPPEAEEFSDDEKERFAKKFGRRRKGRPSAPQPTSSEQEEEHSPRNANLSRKRNFNNSETEGQNSRFPRPPNSHYVPSHHVPGFMPGPPPMYPPHPNYMPHHHYYDNNRGNGPRRMQFRPNFEQGYHHGGSHHVGQWSHYEQPTRHYWRPPPITGKPHWAPFSMNDRVPFEPNGHPRPHIFPKSVIALAAQGGTVRKDNVPPAPKE